jgi:hypothetical protein
MGWWCDRCQTEHDVTACPRGAGSESPPTTGSAFDCEIIDCWLVEGGGAILKLRVPPSAVKIGGVYPLLREADDNCRPVRVTLPTPTLWLRSGATIASSVLLRI